MDICILMVDSHCCMGGFSRVVAGFSSYDREFRLPLVGLEIQSSIRVARGAGDCARVTAGQKRPNLGLCPGSNVALQGRQGSRVCIPDSSGESVLSSRVSKEFRSRLESRWVSLGAHCVY